MYNQSGSRRWTHFRSALQLAIQRSAHKWTFEDFAECFPVYAEEDKNGASATFHSIAEYIESQTINDLEKLFKDYSMQENIDTLHRIVNEAKERKSEGQIGKDVWKEGLDPRTAVCARTVPILEVGVAKLRNTLSLLEEENRTLQAELEESNTAADDAQQIASDLLNKLDTVCDNWDKLPMEEIQDWTMQITESLQPGLPV